jgi:hypothetical protein
MCIYLMLCVYIYYIYIMWERCIPHSHDLYGTKQERFFLAIRNASLGLAGLADGSLSTFRRKYFDPHGCICIYYIYMYNIRGSRQCNAVQRNVPMSVSKSRGTLKSSKI